MTPTLSITPDEAQRRGDALYHQLRLRVEVPENIGKLLLLDIESGDFEIGEDRVTAGDRVRERHPNAILYAIRIGYPAVESMGGWSRPDPKP